MIREDSKGVFGSLEPVTPLFKSGLHGEKVLIVHIVVLFGGSELAREGGAGI